MPQMMPINWLMLFIFFIILFLFFNIMNYYIFTPKLQTFNFSKVNKKTNLNWKW